MNPRDYFNRKVVIITGASSGIGRALAQAAAAHGARVGLIARDAARLDAATAACRAIGAISAARAADVCDPSAVTAAIAGIQAELGPCDILIASAGIHRFSNGRKFVPENAAAVVETNLIGVIHSIGAVIGEMIERRTGHLVAISSLAGYMGLPTVGAYSASKAGVITLMNSLSLDLRDSGVAVTTICPGFIDTPMLGERDRSVIRGLVSPADAAERILTAVSRKRRFYSFPFRTWFYARLGSLMPHGLFAWVWGRLVRMKRRWKEQAERS